MISILKHMRYALLLLLPGHFAVAQVPGDEWVLEDGYQTDLLYLHALANYAYDVEWQFDWERRQFAKNALRINTGSVSSDKLLTDVDLNINEQLSDKWRFFGRFDRAGARRRPGGEESLLLGFEGDVFESSALYIAANPEFNKEFLDVGVGYTLYRDNREQYIRLGLIAEDLNWDTKNQAGGSQEQRPLKLEWALRWPLPEQWWLYSEGKVGQGFERSFADSALSPETATHDRAEDRLEFRVTRGGERYWSAMLEWYRFEEAKTFRTPGFDYDYSNTQLNIGVEHVRVINDRHRWRLLAQFVDQQADSIGFRQHDYERQDIIGGVFYERLKPKGAWTLAYAFSQPDLAYDALDVNASYAQDDYTDKLIVGWRHAFSDNASLRVSVSHEVSAKGFGGGAVQYQMFF